MTVSKTQAKKAGIAIRHGVRDGASYEEVRSALDVMGEWRLQLVPAMNETLALLREVTVAVTGSEAAAANCVSRPKRADSIIAKLVAHPEGPLHTMVDVVGCRAVVDTIDQVYALVGALREAGLSFEHTHVRDYIEHPHPLGYRAVHLHAQRLEHPVEVQLRTVRQHNWAVNVEELGEAFDWDLKHGQGPQAVVDMLAADSSVVHCEERGLLEDEYRSALQRFNDNSAEALRVMQAYIDSTSAEGTH